MKLEIKDFYRSQWHLKSNAIYTFPCRTTGNKRLGNELSQAAQ